MELKIIADIRTDFPEKFGIPRQSGLIEGLKGKIVFRSEYRTKEAVRGLEGFSHLWLLWGFSEVKREGWSATVAPMRKFWRQAGDTRCALLAWRQDSGKS